MNDGTLLDPSMHYVTPEQLQAALKDPRVRLHWFNVGGEFRGPFMRLDRSLRHSFHPHPVKEVRRASKR